MNRKRGRSLVLPLLFLPSGHLALPSYERFPGTELIEEGSTSETKVLTF